MSSPPVRPHFGTYLDDPWPRALGGIHLDAGDIDTLCSGTVSDGGLVARDAFEHLHDGAGQWTLAPESSESATRDTEALKTAIPSG